MIAGARVEVSQEKKNPADFALWKKAEANHIMQWPSPWGQGFPGWHLECSVMSTKYLGQPFDIHGGGLENQFPHHECEIAQSEAATGKQFVNYWLHNNMVTVDGQKMGKSLGNFITLKQLFADSLEAKHERLSRKYDSLAVRQFILTSHYRSTLDFSDEALHAAQSGYDRITEIVKTLRKRIKSIESGAQTFTSVNSDKGINDRLKMITEKFEAAMNDDLNTSVALSVIFQLADITKAALFDPILNIETLKSIDKTFSLLGGNILGIVKDKYQEQDKTDDMQRYELAIGGFIELRNKARREKNFALSDEIRGILGSVGIVLEDKPDKTTWRLG
jgi:cysteinyl-tRNA synthetase